MEIPNLEFHIETKPNIRVDNMLCETQTDNDKHNAQVNVKCENNEAYECNVCGKTFMFLGNMEEHIKSHNETVTVKSEMCVETFSSDHSSESQLVLLSVDEKPYICDQCGNIFDSLSAFELHVRDHDEYEVKYTFDAVCNEDPLALCLSSVKMETTEQTDEKPWVCNKCNILFDSLSVFELHAKEHDEQEVKPRVCDKCGGIFDSLNSLELHIRSHDEYVKVKYTCNTVYGIDSFSSVKTDRPISEQNEKPWLCEKCGCIFDNLNSLEIHVRNHKLTENMYVCTFCNLEFMSNSELQIHAEQIHNNVSTYIKSITEVSCDTLESNVETDRKSYACIWCKQSFDNEDVFKNHSDFLKIKPFNCCGITFKCEGVLQGHFNTMHGTNALVNHEKSFDCEVCAKSFVGEPSFHVHDLESHIPTHTLRKIRSEPFPESNQNPLKNTGTYNDDKERFLCGICNRSFRTKNYLRCHIRIHHSDDRPSAGSSIRNYRKLPRSQCSK